MPFRHWLEQSERTMWNFSTETKESMKVVLAYVRHRRFTSCIVVH